MKKLSNILRAVKQKWAPLRVKRDLWDKEYASGRWKHCELTPDAYVYRFVERYCAHGSILDLGCGSGNTGNEIDFDKYQDYTGVDISSVALSKAENRGQEGGRAAKNKYIEGNIESYIPINQHDVILFRESIYYIPFIKIKTTLDRYRRYLSDDRGVFIVNASKSGSKRFMSILALLEANYEIVEKYKPPGLDAYVLVFR